VTGENFTHRCLASDWRIKEKVLGAKRAGIREVIFPSENEPNVKEDLQPEMLEGIQLSLPANRRRSLDIGPGQVR